MCLSATACVIFVTLDPPVFYIGAMRVQLATTTTTVGILPAGALTIVCLPWSCGGLLLWCGRFLWTAFRFAYPITRSALVFALHLRLALG